MSKLLQNSGTRLPQLMNTSSFYQNVDEGNKSLNAMSPDTLLSEAFGKGSGCARLVSMKIQCFWKALEHQLLHRHTPHHRSRA